MNKRKIYVTAKDKTKLKNLFSAIVGLRSHDMKTVQDLMLELERAEVMDEEMIDDSVIRMNSTVVVRDMQTKKEYTYKLVYPEEANISENKISILAPIGTALLGYKAGDIIEWAVPVGKRKLRVKSVLASPMTA